MSEAERIIEELEAMHADMGERLRQLKHLYATGDHEPISDTTPSPPPAEMATHAPLSIPAPFAPDGATDPGMPPVEPPPVSGVRKRSRTDMTAKEWALSPYFLAYMKKQPFASWSVEKQNEMRDAFIAAQPADEVLNRWGKRFTLFCGVK